VDWWLAQARPYLPLYRSGHARADGPVVGRLGGFTALLPPGLEKLTGEPIATIDLAALPANATDLALPTDGTLILFVSLEAAAYGGHSDGYSDPLGAVVYVPPGADVAERDFTAHDAAGEIQADLTDRDRDLHLGTTTASLPNRYQVSAHIDPDAPQWATHWDGSPLRYGDVPDAWDRLLKHVPRYCHLQIGGYAWGDSLNVDPMTEAAQTAPYPIREEDLVLLAQWNSRAYGIEGVKVYWTIERADLAAHRFERARAITSWAE
jgi:hypothetical protein